MLIAVVDGLQGFPEALETAFPQTPVPTGIVPLSRASLSSASYQERKMLAAALKPIYHAESADRAEVLLDQFEQSELGPRYPDVVRSWHQKGIFVIPFFAFSPLIRKAIYTTNAIESLNATVRRAVHARGHLPVWGRRTSSCISPCAKPVRSGPRQWPIGNLSNANSRFILTVDSILIKAGSQDRKKAYNDHAKTKKCLSSERHGKSSHTQKI